MPQLTERSRRLLRLANLLSQNLMDFDSDADSNRNLAGIDFDLDINLGRRPGETPSPGIPEDPSDDNPESLTELLVSLQNEQVEVTTPFGTVTGTLLAVRDDYIVIIENTGVQVLVRTEKIELVSEL